MNFRAWSVLLHAMLIVRWSLFVSMYATESSKTCARESIVSSTTIFHSFVYGLSFLLLEVRLPTMLFVSFIDSSGIPSHLQFPLFHARGE